MATMDIIKHHGGEPANFLDVGGGATADQIERAFAIVTRDRAVRAVFVNIFGGIMKCDAIAAGVIRASARTSRHASADALPVVIRLRGTNADLGKRMLQESGLPFFVINDLDDAAKTSVGLASQGSCLFA